MDGQSWHAKAELKAMNRRDRKRLLFAKKPLRVRLMRWLKQIINRMLRK